MKVVFEKPYTFEKKEYTEIELTGMEDLTAEDVFAAEAYARKKGGAATVAENSAAYLLHLAASAAQLPIEFMEALPLKEAARVKYAAMGFFQ